MLNCTGMKKPIGWDINDYKIEINYRVILVRLEPNFARKFRETL